MNMFNIRYRGSRVVVSHSAMRELMKEGKALYDVSEILEEGYDAPRVGDD